MAVTIVKVSRTHLRRLLLGCTIAAGFLFVTASIDPDWTRADTGGTTDASTAGSSWAGPAGLSGEILGSLETRTRLITIRATAAGPRYDVHDRTDGTPLAVDLTAEEVTASFPDVPLHGVDFSAPHPDAPIMLMIAPAGDHP